MLTGALKPVEARFVSIIVMLCLLAGTVSAHAAGPARKKRGTETTGQTVPPPSTPAVSIKEWGPYLDVAYELTYWDKGEIKEWRENLERQLGTPLSSYIATWSAKLSGPTNTPGAVREDNRQPVYRERDYLRLAIALTVDYLQSENLESLNSAEQLLDKLLDKATMPEIAYWIGFVKAQQALENNDAPQFVARVFDIWNNAILYIEQGELTAGAPATAASKSAPYLYRNVVNLVVKRAIIDRKLEDVNALGPLFLMLSDRDLQESAAEGTYLTTLVRRIAEGFAAPDSDRYRLNFTVAVIEARRLQKLAAAKLDTEGMSEEAHKVFAQSRLFDDYALKWASSHRSSGAVLAIADYLDITSFAIQRLADNGKAPAYQLFAMLPSHDGSSTLLKAMDIFNDLAAYSDGGWEKAGFANRDLYLKASHRLWRAIMELSLWTGDFYLLQLNTATEQQGIFSAAAPLQAVLNSYLDFLASQTNRGFPDVVPDSACFGAAEAAEKLAYSYLKTYTFSTDSAVYNLWFLRRLQAAELFPLDPREISQTATILRRDGRYNLFLDYFLPLANRFKRSAAVQKWLAEQKPDQAAAVQAYAGAIAELIAAPSGGMSDHEGKPNDQSALTAPLRQLREELQRKPDHPVHKLLRAFYVEEMQTATPYTLLMKDVDRLNRGF
jgi:hypothetical protein